MDAAGGLISGMLNLGSSLINNAVNQNYNEQNMATQQSYNKQNMATQQSYNKQNMATQQSYNKQNMATQQGYNLQNMETQQEYQKAIMRLSDQIQRNYAKDQYNLFRESLNRAGINPIIAAGFSPSQENLTSSNVSSSSPSSSTPSSSNPSSQSINSQTPSGIGNPFDFSSVKSEIESDYLVSQKELNEAHASKISGVDTAKATAETKEVMARIQNLSMQDKKILSDIGLNRSMIEKINEERIQIEKGEFGSKLGTNPTTGSYIDYICNEYLKPAAKVGLTAVATLLGVKKFKAFSNFLINNRTKNYIKSATEWLTKTGHLDSKTVSRVSQLFDSKVW